MGRLFLPTALVALAASLALVLVAAPAEAHTPGEPWPTWGNENTGDCAFAAAANWELVALHHEDSQAEIESEYLTAAHGNNGIRMVELGRWWRTHGIGGIRATVRRARGNDLWRLRSPQQARRRLEPLVRRHHYLLAGVMTAGGHAVLIVGASAAGVTIVSYGEEKLEPWSYWWQNVIGVYTVTPRLKH